MKWLIEVDNLIDDTEKLISAMPDASVYKTIPYGHILSNPDSISDLFNDDDVIFYGCLNSCKIIQKYTSWLPGAMCSFLDFRCTSYYSQIGPYLLNDNYVILPHGDLRRNKEFLYNILGCNNTIFIRPDRSDKIFTGQIVDADGFENFVDSIYPTPHPNELIIIARPHNIWTEWRFVIMNNAVITGSQYRSGARFEIGGYSADAKIFAESIIPHIYMSDPIYVLDIGLNSDGFKVIEIGGFSCAGLYNCDRSIIIQHINTLIISD